MTDTRPPVPPVEGKIAVLRDGSIMGPLFCVKRGSVLIKTSHYVADHTSMIWQPSGASEFNHSLDIIALIDPADILALVKGEG